MLYLEVPYGSAPLEFYNPRSSNKAWVLYLDQKTTIKKNDIYSVDDNHAITVNPHQGLFVFWESWADHKVPVNDSSLGRKTIVFNVGVKDA